MIFFLVLVLLISSIFITLFRDYRKSKSFTPISWVTASNFLYCSITPIVEYYWSNSALNFVSYVNETGMIIDEGGLLKLLIVASLFQMALLSFAWNISGKKTNFTLRGQLFSQFASSCIFIGWLMLIVGFCGVILFGLSYNGSPWGLYQISYFERSPLFIENSSFAFLLLAGIYGASQLVVSYLLLGQLKSAASVLLLITLHGIAIKSKFPIFWVSFVFVTVAIGERLSLRNVFLPLSISLLTLSVMSFIRGAEGGLNLMTHVNAGDGEILIGMFKFWENDIPGPASIMYYVFNQSEFDLTLAPLIDILKILIPSFIISRDALITEVWAAKMMGAAYEPGLGYGWLIFNDGYLVAGWVGVFAVSLIISWLVRFFSELINSKRFYISIVIGYTASPLLFYALRESLAGLIKSILIMALVIWIPTFMLIAARRMKLFNHNSYE